MLTNVHDKELQGSVLTVISYLSAHQEARALIGKKQVIHRVLQPITTLHELDQKMQLVALATMLFNDLTIQKEFLKEEGLNKLTYFLQNPDKLFH
jgi:hypothetical protein